MSEFLAAFPLTKHLDTLDTPTPTLSPAGRSDCML